jgi:hypothetical protein
MHEGADRLVFAFDKDDLRLAFRWYGGHGLSFFCFDGKFDFVVAAGIRQSGSPDLPTTGKRCTEKQCTKTWPHLDSPKDKNTRRTV